VEGDIIELELEQEVEKLPAPQEQFPIVLTAKYAGQLIVTVGQVIEHENFGGVHGIEMPPWSRIKIKGSSVTFTI